MIDNFYKTTKFNYIALIYLLQKWSMMDSLLVVLPTTRVKSFHCIPDVYHHFYSNHGDKCLVKLKYCMISVVTVIVILTCYQQYRYTPSVSFSVTAD